jgi:hypothetical protein
MNRVDSSDAFRASGRSLVTDYYGNSPPVSPVRETVADALLAAAEPNRSGVTALLGRMSAGLGVQALVNGDGETFITIWLNGATETFPVPAAKLLDAFDHPYVYGATLPL